jgi:glycosyltransferase involved in cell wall biosynthesis
MNILITSPSLEAKNNVSGISSMVATIIEHNRDQSYYHYIFGRKDYNSVRLFAILLLLKQLLLFPFALRKYRINLVHQNFPFDEKGILRETVVRLWCRLFRVPVVLHIHGGKFMTLSTGNQLYRFLAKRLFRCSKAVAVLSEIEKDNVAKVYGYKDAIVLPNCIDDTFLSLYTARQMNAIPVFLYIGRLDEAKGLYEIAEAFRLLKNAGVLLKFSLCGNGGLKSIISEFENILGDDFTYHGVVWGETKNSIISKSDFFLLPSWFEGLPVALLETMAAGCVPIVTDVGAIGQYVKDGVSGIIVEQKSPQDLFRKIRKIIDEPTLFKTLSQNAYKIVADSCNVKEYVFHLNFIYEQCFQS